VQGRDPGQLSPLDQVPALNSQGSDRLARLLTSIAKHPEVHVLFLASMPDIALITDPMR